MEKNYPYWSYVMKNFLKGKRMWGYVGGTFVVPQHHGAQGEFSEGLP